MSTDPTRSDVGHEFVSMEAGAPPRVTAAAARPRQSEIDATIAGSGLPVELIDRIRKVVRGTRLWRAERLDVARELIAHFGDGLAAGRSAEELTADFGQPSRSARLIRRAKRRARPLWWRGLFYARRAVGIVLVVSLLTYGYLAARYFLARPTIRHNYMAELNNATLETGESDRAWPVYLAAWAALGPQSDTFTNAPWPIRPGMEKYDEGVAYVRTLGSALELARAASARPTIGYVLGKASDDEFMMVSSKRNPGWNFEPDPNAEENPTMIGVLLPYLGPMRQFASLLTIDATDAAAAGDTQRFVANVEAILGIADQAAGDRFIISRMVSMHVADLAYGLVRDYAAREDLLDADELARLAHRIAAFADGRLTFADASEEVMWKDLLQRFYTDDGRGDGVLVEHAFDDLYAEFGIANPNRSRLYRSLQPVRAAAGPSRAELGAAIGAYLAAFRHDDALPPWRSDERGAEQAFRRVYESGALPLEPLKALLGAEPMGRCVVRRDESEARRGAALVACAVESHRREFGEYPATLNELVPKRLPRLPRDPFDGDPIRYKLAGAGADARPVLYSIGVDLGDDGGVGPTDAKDQDAVHDLSRLGESRERQSAGSLPADWPGRGDWVLYSPAGGVTEPKPAGVP